MPPASTIDFFDPVYDSGNDGLILNFYNVNNQNTRLGNFFSQKNEIRYDEDVVLYPNPAISNIEVRSFSGFVNRLQIFSSKGLILQDVDGINKLDFSINVSSFSTGVYYFRILVSEKWISKKVVIRKE